MAYQDRFYKVRVPTARKYWSLNNVERHSVMDKLVLKNCIEYSKMLLSIPEKERIRIESRIQNNRPSGEYGTETFLRRFDEDMDKFYSYFNRLQPYLPSFQERILSQVPQPEAVPEMAPVEPPKAAAFDAQTYGFQVDDQLEPEADILPQKMEQFEQQELDYIPPKEAFYRPELSQPEYSQLAPYTQPQYELAAGGVEKPYEMHTTMSELEADNDVDAFIDDSLDNDSFGCMEHHERDQIQKQNLSDWIQQMRRDLETYNLTRDDNFSDFSTATISDPSKFSESDYE